MTELISGALLDRMPGPTYLAELRFFELALPNALPRPATVATWKAELPNECSIAVVAPTACISSEKGPMRLDEFLETSLERLRATATALGARFLIVPTGRELSTGQRDRDLIRAYLEHVRGQWTVVWSPRGLWEPPSAERFCNELGVLYGFDALDRAAYPSGTTLYGRGRGVGMMSHLSEGVLMNVVERVAATGTDTCHVAIESDRSFREATRLKALWAEATATDA